MSNKENDKGHEISPGMLRISMSASREPEDDFLSRHIREHGGIRLKEEQLLLSAFAPHPPRRKWSWRSVMLNVLRVVGLILIALYFTACGHLRLQDDPLYYTNKVDSQDEYSNPWVALEKTKHVKTRYLEGEKEPLPVDYVIIIDARDLKSRK